MTNHSVRLHREERMKSNSDKVKILIDNVIRIIKLNALVFCVQEIHGHLVKYVEILEIFLSKSYDFESTECINLVLKTETMSEFKKSSFRTLIIEESTDISV
ncbi:hypothetical protein RF11_06853 [Thelohanellus kitauei]|uniref:Uncharacterized protein n=1 Tax=Thelohanellus kitauei TaxID=669202 RepID=A0A0C2MKP5_THEKT|nr:hypothetical protein RF11_06853 [Thelohanellus kitauei]